MKIADLRQLGKQFKASEQLFLSYIFNLTYFHLSDDPQQKLDAGMEALDACIQTNHFLEADLLVDLLITSFPGLKTNLTYKYGYLLLKAGEFNDGDIYLRDLHNINDLRDRVYFLRAYGKLNANLPQQSLEFLNDIEENTFPHPKPLQEIKTALQQKPEGARKYRAIALPLSIVLPGAGQAYAGFWFDAIQDFGFNLVLGYAAYASWQREFDFKRENRNYAMPVFSTAVWGVFYLTNLVNAANVTEKANLFRENAHYRKILDRFQIVMKDDDYFLNIKFEF